MNDKTLATVKNTFADFFDFIDSRVIIRRGVLIFTLYMTYWVTHKAWLFAQTSTFDGVGTAAIIAAIMVPTGALQAFAFASYSNGRG